ncbi:MAG: hypothetical protein IJO64_05130 [Clostridia bacterium]|nr:hypothetical protein [Clostridia bacterium]
MKKIICLIIALMMLTAVACNESTDSENSSSANESSVIVSDDINSNSSTETESSETESSVSDETSFETSDETSDESSLPYVFEPRSWAEGYLVCDHGAVYEQNWFHYLSMPFVYVYVPDVETLEDAIRADQGLVMMTDDEFNDWYRSETPDEYKFECNIHNPDEILDDNWEGIDPEPYKNKNVVMFVRQFNVDKEDFKRLYYDPRFYHSLYHDPDVLFDWEYQDACNWYFDYYNKYRHILEAKDVLAGVRSRIAFKYNDNKNVRMSCAQAIYEFNVPREVVEKWIEIELNEEKRYNEKLHTGEIVIKFKLDEVYNRSEEFMDLLEKVNNGEIYPMELDDWFVSYEINASNTND